MSRNMWLSLTAAALSAALVYVLYDLQRMQVERQETVAVVVPSRFIAAGERIEAGDLERLRLPAGAYHADMLTEPQAAAGKEAIVPMGRGEPVLEWKLNEYGLQPGKLESTFQLPKDYIRSISSGIRAGDLVMLYSSGEEGESARVFDKPVVVASVKTSGNVEIDNMEKPHLLSLAEGNKEEMYAARRDANGTIEFINLNLTESQWLVIDKLCKGGTTKLVIAYSPASFERMGQAQTNMPGKEGTER
ncbi:SAF domain-containing protein [Paenibacillus sp. LHD-117]|uniref:SAF domain-containing protein n=1 Tax=Paenibacillus sp. LHD-117 TaxID=3071412 RepID=UPI0027DFA717|nr:SAF domain-containing protein [Paenibacillus sp. LHD-117]MDQ6422830.1 SAF domain-containing protein [Paenibacillus sp. LHD-117]